MKRGQCVRLKFATTDEAAQPGHVRQVYDDGSFQVVYPVIRHPKTKRRVRQAYTYPASTAACFTVVS